VAKFAEGKLVGRERELDALITAVSTPPTLVLVEGEAGVGKTTLVRAMCADPSVADRQVVVGSCHTLDEAVPFGVVIDALRGLDRQRLPPSMRAVAGALRPLLPELHAFLPQPPDPTGDARVERHRTLRAVRELLNAAGPTVLVLEDVHWADAATLELLRFLVAEPPAHLALVVTYRREALDAASPVRGLAGQVSAEVERAWVDVPPLELVEVRELAAARLRLDAERVPEHFAAVLHARTGGLALAVEETLRLLQDRTGLTPAQGVWPGERELQELGIPRGLRDAIEQRLGLLSHDARRLVEAAAVLAVPSSELVLRCVAGLPAPRARRALGQALQAGLVAVAGDGVYAPRHPLAADAVRDGTPAPQRRWLHARAARELQAADGPEPLAQLAYHFKGAGLIRRWVRYAERAADAAVAAGDDLAAVRLLQEPLRRGELPRATTIRLAGKLGQAAVAALTPTGNVEILRGAVDDDALRPGVRGGLRIALARLLVQTGDARTAEGQLRQAVTELRRRPRLAACAMAFLASPWSPHGSEDEHRDWLERAQETAAGQDAPDATRLVQSTRATTLLALGDPAGWSELEDPAPAHRPPPDRLAILHCFTTAVAAFHLGHYDTAEEFLDRARQGCERLAQRRWVPMLEAVRLLLDWATGDWTGLEVRAHQQLQTSPQVPATLTLGTRRVLATFLLHRGALAEAEESLQAVSETAAAASLPGLAGAGAQLALLQLARGDAQAAWDAAAPAVAAMRAKGVWVWAGELIPVATEVLLAAGRRDEADTLVREFADGLRGRDAPAANAAYLWARALLRQGQDSFGGVAKDFAQAARAWEALPRPHEAARAREHQGQCLLAHGDARGGQALEQALATQHEIGAAWDVERLKGVFRSHGLALPKPWRGGRRTYGGTLSPRERAVAHLAGAGRTNREIGAELFLSPRTVEDHVATARRKLGVDTRHALADDEAVDVADTS
jgi:DNA-binding CsgD family transcriptional regulator